MICYREKPMGRFHDCLNAGSTMVYKLSKREDILSMVCQGCSD